MQVLSHFQQHRAKFLESWRGQERGIPRATTRGSCHPRRSTTRGECETRRTRRLWVSGRARQLPRVVLKGWTRPIPTRWYSRVLRVYAGSGAVTKARSLLAHCSSWRIPRRWTSRAVQRSWTRTLRSAAWMHLRGKSCREYPAEGARTPRFWPFLCACLVRVDVTRTILIFIVEKLWEGKRTNWSARCRKEKSRYG